MITDIELAKMLLEKGANITEILSDDEVINKLNNPTFQRFLLRFLKAKAFASLPIAVAKLLEMAESGKESAIISLFKLLNIDFKEVENIPADLNSLRHTIEEILSKPR